MNGEARGEEVEVEISVYNDVWMDNGLENLYKILKDVNDVKVELEKNHLRFYSLDRTQFLDSLKRTIIEKMNRVIFVKRINERTGEVKNVKKDYILSQYGKKIDGKNVLKEKIYSETENRLREIFDSTNVGNKTCMICGKYYSKNVDKLKQSVYPLVTKIRSLSGIRTKGILKDYNDALCPFCYLVGSLEWTDENIIFRSFLGGGERRYSIVILPLMSNLAELHRFKDLYLPMVRDNVQDLFSNIRTHAGYIEGESTILLYFYENFFKDVWFHEEVPKDLLEFSGVKKEICKEWVVMKVPSGAVKNIKYTKLKISDNALRTIFELTKNNKLIYSGFISKIFFRFEKRNLEREREISQEIKEGISGAFLNNDLSRFASYLLPRKDGYVAVPTEAENVLNKLIHIWKWYKMGMSEEELKGLKNVAKIVAEVAEEGHISILYKLDKARNPDEFLSGLRELGKRIIGLKEEKRRKIYPPSLENLVEILEMNKENNERFEDIKNVLVIFSCVELSQIKYLKTGGKENEQKH